MQRTNPFDAIWATAQALMRMPDIEAITEAAVNVDFNNPMMSVPLGSSPDKPQYGIVISTVLGESIAIETPDDFLGWLRRALGMYAVKGFPTPKVYGDALELWLFSTPEGITFKRAFNPVLAIISKASDGPVLETVFSEGEERAAIMRALDNAATMNKTVDFVEIGDLEKASDFLFRIGSFLSGYDDTPAREARNLGVKLNQLAGRVKSLVYAGDPNGATINVIVRDQNEDNGGPFAPLDGENRAMLEQFYLQIARDRERLAAAMEVPEPSQPVLDADRMQKIMDNVMAQKHERLRAEAEAVTPGPGAKIGEAFANAGIEQRRRNVEARIFGREQVYADTENRFSPG